ncbi:hypothetical protein ACWA2B_27320, partial [Paenibacillus sp. CMM36]
MNKHFTDKLISISKSIEKCELDTVYLDLFSLNLIETHVQYSKAGDFILFAKNHKNIPLEKHNALIYELLEYNAMLNLDILSKDIKIFFNLLINQITDKLLLIIETFDKEDMLINLYVLSSYIIQFHQRTRLILRGDLKLVNIKSINLLESSLLEAIESSNGIMDHDIDSIQGLDKAIIQYLFALIMKPKLSKSHLYNFNRDAFRQMYYLSYSAITLISQRELVMSRVFQNKNIKIINGVISFEDNNWHKVLNKFKKEIVDERTKMPFEDLPKIADELKNNFKKNLGFDFDYLNSLLEFESYSIEKEKRLAHIFSKINLVSLVQNVTKCKEDEAECLIDYLTLRISDHSEYLDPLDKYRYRLLEKPLLQLEISSQSIYLLSLPLLINSVQLLSSRLMYNLIPECTKDNSDIIKNNIKNETVLTASNIFKIHTNKVFTNAKDFNYKGKKFSFNCEYDILTVINDVLIVSECKDITYKFTTFGLKKDIGKTIDYINEIAYEMIEIKNNLIVLEDIFQTKIN